MRKIGLILLIMGIVASGCEKIIDISVPDQERKIVLNSVLNPDSLISVQLTRSKSVLEDNQTVAIEDAELRLYEDGNFIANLDYSGYSFYKLDDFYPSIEKKYRIEVDHSVLASVDAEVLMPPQVPILEVDTSRYQDQDENERYSLNVKISDPGGVENYYALSLAVTSRVFDWNTQELTDSLETFMIYFHTVEEGESLGGDLFNQDVNHFIDDKLFISDGVFDGQDHEFALAIDYYFLEFQSDTIILDVRLDHIDPSYYYYSVSKQKYYRANGSPFSEPVQVYNNINNGFGILSSYTRSSRQYVIDISDTRE